MHEAFHGQLGGLQLDHDDVSRASVPDTQGTTASEFFGAYLSFFFADRDNKTKWKTSLLCFPT